MKVVVSSPRQKLRMGWGRHTRGSAGAVGGQMDYSGDSCGEGGSDSKNKPGCLKPYQLITDTSAPPQPLFPSPEIPGAHQAQFISQLLPSSPIQPPSVVATGALSNSSLSLGHCCTCTSFLFRWLMLPWVPETRACAPGGGPAAWDWAAGG